MQDLITKRRYTGVAPDFIHKYQVYDDGELQPPKRSERRRKRRKRRKRPKTWKRQKRRKRPPPSFHVLYVVNFGQW